MAVYMLPRSSSRPSGERSAVYGKTTEEFYFPVGSWSGRVDLDATRTVDGKVDPELVEAWFHRKHKALFSYDPLLVNGETGTSLYLVIQIYKVAQRNSVAPYLSKGDVLHAEHGVASTPTKKKGMGRRIRKKFGKVAKGVASGAKDVPIDMDAVKAGASDAFDTFGTQFLTPLCFGVCPFTPDAADPNALSSGGGVNMAWPEGATEIMDLYSHSPIAESQEQFVERLIRIVSEDRAVMEDGLRADSDPVNLSGTSDHGSITGWDDPPNASDAAITSSTSSTSLDNAAGTGSKKSLNFKLQRHSKSSTNIPASQQTERLDKARKSSGMEPSYEVAGTASIFCSVLGVDFTQSMLHTPTVLAGSSEKSSKLPRLLVDASGRCALMINPSQDQPSPLSISGHESSRKRSDLVRLPPATNLSGYMNASEVRELLYLPPRAEKQYDVDETPSHRSFVNLLYMYPLSLKLSNNPEGYNETRPAKGRPRTYSVRIQLVKNSTEVDEDTGQLKSVHEAMELFHNPTPWTGPQLLEAVYTKIPEGLHERQSSTEVLKKGLPLRDEVKLRLPEILDGSYNLQFTLFAIEFSDHSVAHSAGISVESIAETTIPLASSSTREATSGVKITTIIPNGRHRLKLGDFQFHMESRLVSSIHVADTAIATALRDFPFKGEQSQRDGDESTAELSLVPSRSIVGRSPSADPIVDLKVPFHTVFSAASENTIFEHFHVLVHMHLCNLVSSSTTELNVSGLAERSKERGSSSEFETSDIKYVEENMRSLFEILRKVKLKLKKQTNPRYIQKRVDMFVKGFIDEFDEAILHGHQDGTFDGIPGQILQNVSGRSRSSVSTETVEKSAGWSASQDDATEEDMEESADSGAIRMKRKSAIKNELDLRVSRTLSALGQAGIPFSRVAYGASKTDRMRLEAEMHHEGSRFTHLFDDDETVATFLTAGTELHMPDDRNAKVDGKQDSPVRGENPLRRTDSDNSVAEKGDGSIAEANARMGLLAKRVRTVAQTMIAPCMAPSLSTILANGGGVGPSKEASETSIYEIGTLRKHQDPFETSENTKTSSIETPVQVIITVGSDVDEDNHGDETHDQHLVVSNNTGEIEGCLRGPLRDKTLTFVFGRLPGDQEGGFEPSPFVYEVVMVTWLKSWLDRVDKQESREKDGSGGISIVSIPQFDPSATRAELLLSFHGNMDVLLPLCLKSILLRCTETQPESKPNARLMFDHGHMLVFEPFVKMLGQKVLGEALWGPDKTESATKALLRALASAQLVVNFLIGLASVLNPYQFSILLSTYLTTLREGEAQQSRRDSKFVWDASTLRRVLCSRRLRLRAVEQLSVLANFVAINFPLKYNDYNGQGKARATSWTSQCLPTLESESGSNHASIYSDGIERLPLSGWLATMLASESLSICSLSCEAVVAEAIAQVESTQKDENGDPSYTAKLLSQRPGERLNREDLLRLQSMAIHAVTCVYELLLRRHAMDSRFQTEGARTRLAALFAPVILEKSLGSVRWMARMESTHKVRSNWLLCLAYILQESPEAMIRSQFRLYCRSPDFQIHKVIRLLRLSSSTFQSFSELQKQSDPSTSAAMSLSPWFLQESFNTIAASLNVLVDECLHPISRFPKEEKKMAQGVLDLLLHILTAPQSAVTQLRTIGGALETLNKLGVDLFLENAGGSLQNWIRVILTLMNSVSLSVRSIAVDFVVSLLGESFKLTGSVDEITVIFATIVPEVAAREIALYSVDGLVGSIKDVESAVWPLRRALADIEEANPLDDDRVDPQLSPILSVFCRACQAIIDGVLIELRLRGSECTIVGSKLRLEAWSEYVFDADEESLYEAASFFAPETAPMQRLRWLFTLKVLHESKEQWVEAAETLIMCARTISDALPHVRTVWRPSRFVLWYDNRRSSWLSSIGETAGHPDRGNTQVMQFADEFLEPPELFDTATAKIGALTKLPQPSVHTLCDKLVSVSKEAVTKYLMETGTEHLAFSRVEALLRIVMTAIDDHGAVNTTQGGMPIPITTRRRLVEESAALQRVSTSLNAELTKLAESLVLENDQHNETPSRRERINQVHARDTTSRHDYFVKIVLSGNKPNRFQESTTIPTFLEWNGACICRVPTEVVKRAVANKKAGKFEERICHEFGKPLRDALNNANPTGSVLFRTGVRADDEQEMGQTSVTYLNVSVVQMGIPPTADGASKRGEISSNTLPLESKRFFYRKSSSSEPPPGVRHPGGEIAELMPTVTCNLVELTVAHPFPSALSRQRTVITSEFLSNGVPSYSSHVTKSNSFQV